MLALLNNRKKLAKCLKIENPDRNHLKYYNQIRFFIRDTGSLIERTSAELE